MKASKRSTKQPSREPLSGSSDPARRASFARGGPPLFPLLIALLAVLAVFWLPSCRSGAPGKGGGGGDSEQLRRKIVDLNLQEQAVAAEYSLARNPAPYLVVDLTARRIDLKARGRSLRVFKVVDIRRQEGAPEAVAIWSLTDKKPLEESERPKIEPGAGEEAAAEAAKQSLWGPHQMPADYDLLCGNGKVLEIRGLPPEQSGSRLSRWLQALYRRTADWYRRWRRPEAERQVYKLQLWLSDDNARLLFWSLPKQLNILVLDGARLPDSSPAIPAVQEAGK